MNGWIALRGDFELGLKEGKSIQSPPYKRKERSRLSTEHTLVPFVMIWGSCPGVKVFGTKS